jgi:hypothetical protein
LKDVQGLPTTFGHGLFDNLEGGLSPLISMHAGTCLPERGQEISPQRYVVLSSLFLVPDYDVIGLPFWPLSILTKQRDVLRSEI